MFTDSLPGDSGKVHQLETTFSTVIAASKDAHLVVADSGKLGVIRSAQPLAL
jgi:hypothetical protein